MKILVTAGNTLTLIDRVRAITNIFTGKTGASIALAAHERGHTVTLLTSHPDTVSHICSDNWNLQTYRTFDDLRSLLKQQLATGSYDALVHSAAVSDYQAAGVFAPAVHTTFDVDHGQWRSENDFPQLVDRSAGKVKSDEHELWIRLTRTPKLVDLVRSEWGFTGLLVKFKLEVAISDEQLLEIAERSRQHSDANLMIANTLEGAGDYAFLGPLGGEYQRISRSDLAMKILETIEEMNGGCTNG